MQPIDLQDDDASSSDRYVPRELRETMVLALRLALGARGAPERCRRRICKRTGRCYLDIDAEGVGFCPAGIDRAAMEQAAMMLHFLDQLWKSRFGDARLPRQ